MFAHFIGNSWTLTDSCRLLPNALTRKWPKGERLIAEAMGVRPELIWPSRYTRITCN
ncbi:Ner family regulatory protein [Rahnella aquatilis CIP 78.65 = ATCC 33071]|nr:Ner family regulatory protein [Rahnella aquatilis CIP 78.65 = ATCC 33071]